MGGYTGAESLVWVVSLPVKSAWLDSCLEKLEADGMQHLAILRATLLQRRYDAAMGKRGRKPKDKTTTIETASAPALPARHPDALTAPSGNGTVLAIVKPTAETRKLALDRVIAGSPSFRVAARTGCRAAI